MGKDRSIPWLAATASAALLLLSLISGWPFGYHILLRYVVGVSAIVMLVQADQIGARRWMMVWAVVAIVYNPIVPLILPRGARQLVTLLCSGLFVVAIRRFRL